MPDGYAPLSSFGETVINALATGSGSCNGNTYIEYFVGIGDNNDGGYSTDYHRVFRTVRVQ